MMKKQERVQREERERVQRELRKKDERERKKREARERARRIFHNEVKWKPMPQYFASASRGVRVCQETGIICYDPPPSGTPVGQFIAPKPLSKYNSKFSLTIMATGSFKAIAIGLVPRDYQQNQQPGCDSYSIGYHADDGGIFIESGWLMHRREKCDVGDVMEVEIDVLRKKGWFRKNGSQMFEFDLNTFGLYPCVGFHSKGTAVKLNEIKVWTAENKSDPTTTPNDFRTYMYDTLWISEMIYVKERDEACSGWVILHNPTHIPVAYKVTVGKNVYVKQGQLKPKKEFLDFVHICDMNKLEQINQTTVEWVLLESGREYSDKDLDRSLADMTETCTHILDVELLYASSVMPLLQEKEERLRQMMGQVDQEGILSKSADLAKGIRALPMGKRYHVFFSYSNSDIEWVTKTVKVLENEYGLVCCVHHRDNNPRTPYLQFAANSIRHAYKTVAVITREACQCDFVLCEIQMAFTQGCNEHRECVVPVILEDCDRPDFISALNVVDAQDPKKMNIWLPKLLAELKIDDDIMCLKDNHPQSPFDLHKLSEPEKHTDMEIKLTNMYMDKQGVSFHLATELENSLMSIEKNADFRLWLGTDIAKQTIVFVCLYRGLMQKSLQSFMGIDIYYKDSETPLRPLEPTHKMPNDCETSLGFKDAELLQKVISIHGGKLFKKHSNLEAVTGSSFLLSKSRGCMQCPSVVLYCRVKGICPLGEVAFPKILSTGEDSLRVFTDVREGYLRQGMHQPIDMSRGQGDYRQSILTRTEWHEILRMGTSIGVQGGNQGTLGPFVKINTTEDGFLTCSHVIVSDPRDKVALAQSVRLSVLQPADGETHPNVQKPIKVRRCGEVSRIVFREEMSFPLIGLPERVGVDAALITANGSRHVDSRSFPFIPERDLRNAGFDPHNPPLYGHRSIRYPLKFKDVQGSRVIKYGATTGLTKGTLQLNGTMVKVHDANLKLPVNNASVIMMGQYVVDRQGENCFFKLGDSGAGVFMVDAENKLTCIGLGIGYLDEWQTVVTPIEYVLKALGLELDAMEFEEDMVI